MLKFKKAQSIVETLKVKSNEALDIFNKTKNNLAEVNAAVIQELANNAAKVQELESEIDKVNANSVELNEIKKGNYKLIQKINDFLS